VFANPNCFSFQEIFPGGFTPSFGGDVTEDDVLEFLLRALDHGKPIVPERFKPADAVADVLDTFRALTRIHPDSLGAYVITMASRPEAKTLSARPFEPTLELR
jgi:hypothetical protein